MGKNDVTFLSSLPSFFFEQQLLIKDGNMYRRHKSWKSTTSIKGIYEKMVFPDDSKSQ
jgi:hypothetical protein